MSDQVPNARRGFRLWRANRSDADSGVTLPEVLITMVLTGTIVTALAAAMTVVLRQSDNTGGRLNNARSEQAVGIWLPSDLASAEQVDTGPGASPCGTSCPASANTGGSNALMLTWTSSVAVSGVATTVTTNVSYRYVQVGEEYQLVRVACESTGGGAWECRTVVVLHDLDAPPPGQAWIPGETSPDWVILVSLALDPADPGIPGSTVVSDPSYRTKNGQRVIVTINGGGDLAGSGGGVDQITLSAGGTDRQPDLGTSTFSDPPSFATTRSRCGGNFGMLVDTSNSISSTNMGSVRNGITEFINAFAGTPIKLQIVKFSTNATTLGGGWTRYFDMLIESDVAALKTAVAGLNRDGGTNWEDAFFRMFRNSDGTTQTELPATLIFFTDGVPTYSRIDSTTASAPVTPHPEDAAFPASTGSTYSQIGWNRANRVARQYDADVERFIGVFVGSATNETSTWRENGAGYHLEDFERGYNFTYFRGYRTTNWQRGYNNTYQRANSGLTYERKQGNNWNSTNRSNYESNNSSPGDSDGWRVRVTGTLGSWTSTTETLYNRSNTNANDTDGFRIVKNYSSPYNLWESTTESSYNSNNSNSGESDGWRATISYTAPYTAWETSTASAYNSNNSVDGDSDGWRQVKNYSSPYSAWETTTETAYNSGNSSWGDTDGWRAVKVYEPPFTAYENPTTQSLANTTILGRIVTTGAAVPAVQSGGQYTNAAVADLYILPQWDQFADALVSVALAECGGTLTVQTKVGNNAAPDPFTYQNSVDLTVATTSSQYKSGTFDFEMPDGGSESVTLTPLNTSGLSGYSPAATPWSCKVAGANVPIVVTPIPGSPWSSVTVTVRPNQAVSCVQSVVFN